MPETTPTITSVQAGRLEILRLLMNDTAAAQKAIDWIADDPLKMELFKDQYHLVVKETGPVARTEKAIQECKEALHLFN